MAASHTTMRIGYIGLRRLLQPKWKVDARTLALLPNAPEVRAHLISLGIDIPGQV